MNQRPRGQGLGGRTLGIVPRILPGGILILTPGAAAWMLVLVLGLFARPGRVLGTWRTIAPSITLLAGTSLLAAAATFPENDTGELINTTKFALMAAMLFAGYYSGLPFTRIQGMATATAAIIVGASALAHLSNFAAIRPPDNNTGAILLFCWHLLSLMAEELRYALHSP